MGFSHSNPVFSTIYLFLSVFGPVSSSRSLATVEKVAINLKKFKTNGNLITKRLIPRKTCQYHMSASFPAATVAELFALKLN